MKLSVLGIGLMGAPMARNLVAAGLDVTVWNRSIEKARAIDGAAVAETPTQATVGADIVLTMLRDGPVTHEVLSNGGVMTALAPGTLLIDTASIPPATARTHGAMAAARGVGYVDAPVSGGTTGAADGSLAIMAGGEESDFERAKPVLDILGRATHVGPVGSGQLVKLANQAIVAITIGAVGEAMLLCKKGGADLEAMREALMGGFANSRILTEHGRRMIDRNFVPGGKAAIHLKDLDTVVTEAENLGLTLPVTAVLQSLFTDLCTERDGETLDHSALLLHLESINGL